MSERKTQELRTVYNGHFSVLASFCIINNWKCCKTNKYFFIFLYKLFLYCILRFALSNRGLFSPLPPVCYCLWSWSCHVAAIQYRQTRSSRRHNHSQLKHDIPWYTIHHHHLHMWQLYGLEKLIKFARGVSDPLIPSIQKLIR